MFISKQAHDGNYTNSLGIWDHMRAQLLASDSNRFLPRPKLHVLQNPTMADSTYVLVIKSSFHTPLDAAGYDIA